MMGDRGRSGRSGGRGRIERSPNRRDDEDYRRDHGSNRGRRDHSNSGRDNGRHREAGAGQGYASMGIRGGQPMFSGQAFSENELLTDLPKKKFTGRCRLFVGNLPNEVTEQELKDLFSPHGDIAECYLSGKGFAFLRMDTRAHAESAKETIDGKLIHGRPVRVRFAVHGAALRVKELSPTVSNEMLYHAFSHFGEVERAVHIVDEKGRPTGEGIVEFERKPSANEALHQIKEKVFLLTAGPKPLVVEPLEPRDEDDGLAERMIQRTAQLLKEREIGPRFPPPNSFEYVYGMKWKELYEVERRRKAELEEELKQARSRLEADMELAYQDYQAQMLREDLQRRQQELERLEAARRERMSQAQNQPSPFMNMRGPMFNGGAPEPFNAFSSGPGGGGPPPFVNQQPPRGGPPQGGGPGQPPYATAATSDPNFMQGMQKLLQIIRPDRNAGDGPGQGPPPGFFGGGGGPSMGGSSPFTGAPGPSPFGDFPPEKRLRR